MPRNAGRTLRYHILRCCERIDPTVVYGKPWGSLSREQQREFLGYGSLRDSEDAQVLAMQAQQRIK